MGAAHAAEGSAAPSSAAGAVVEPWWRFEGSRGGAPTGEPGGSVLSAAPQLPALRRVETKRRPSPALLAMMTRPSMRACALTKRALCSERARAHVRAGDRLLARHLHRAAHLIQAIRRDAIWGRVDGTYSKVFSVPNLRKQPLHVGAARFQALTLGAASRYARRVQDVYSRHELPMRQREARFCHQQSRIQGVSRALC